MKRFFSFLIIIFLSFLLVSPAHAAENWTITNYQTEITIQSDGRVLVKETIDVDFNSLQKRGIFRDIPEQYYTEDGNIYTELSVIEVLQDGTKANYLATKDGNFLRIRIGNENRIISGKHSYQIQYLATGVLRSFEDYDEVYWDATGNSWPVPILKASVEVNSPLGGITRTTCFQGEIGSNDLCRKIRTTKTQAVFQATNVLQPSEGLTVVVGYTKGLVPIISVAPPIPDQRGTTTPGVDVYAPNVPTLLLSIIGGTGSAFLLWWKRGREQRGYKTLMVEYSPPNKLRPAEVGTLFDEKANMQDITATIIDLATKGYLTITEEPKKGFFGTTDYTLSKKSKDDSALLPYEKELLSGLFHKKDTIEVSELGFEFYETIIAVKDELYKDVIAKNFFRTNPEKIKTRYALLGILLFIIGVIGFIGGIFEPSGNISAVAIAVFIMGIIFIILSPSFPKRTSSGHEIFRKILGYKLFIDKVETYKQQYLERKNIFTEILPYAIAFGVVEKFAKAFEKLGIEPIQPSWYSSSRPFNPITFTSSIHNFSNSLISSTIPESTSRNHSFVSSRSGFSSGGSSGGGFGGGGGGSW